LDVLLSRGTVEEYPALCAEITARFSTISQKIIEVKVSSIGLNYDHIVVYWFANHNMKLCMDVESIEIA
jgi:hypothetical protein